jgi:hypothetical protein
MENERPHGIIVDRRKRLPFVLVERVVLRARNLSNNAKLLYLFLADYAGEEGSCFPGQLRLARDLCFKSVDTVQRALNELRAYLLIDWKRRGLNKPNVYYLLPLEGNPNLILPSHLPQATGEADAARMRCPETAPVRRLETASKRYYQDPGEQDSGQQHAAQIASRKTPSPAALDAEQGVVVGELRKRGISARAAGRLATTYPLGRIREKIELLDYFASVSSPLVAKSPAGWLRRAVEEDFAPPPAYLKAKAARTRSQTAAAESSHDRARQLREEAAWHAQDPAERASRHLTLMEQSRRAMRRRRMTSDERERSLAELIDTFTKQREQFFASNPGLLPRAPAKAAAPNVPTPSASQTVSSTGRT